MKAVVRRAEANEGHRQQRSPKWVKIDGFDPLLVPSDLPQQPDIFSIRRHASKVPNPDVAGQSTIDRREVD
jgi:hypothetical protein